MIKTVQILSFINKSLSFEWIVNEFSKIKNHQLIFILLNDTQDTEIENFLRDHKIETYFIEYTGKKDIIKALWHLIHILRKIQPDNIHCHLFDASLIGLLAGKLCGIKKRIYTRHNATIHHVYHPHMVKYDKFINFLSTDIIAISFSVKKILIDLEGVPEKKIHLIYHGFNFDDFKNIGYERTYRIIQKYNIPVNDKRIIGVISRYIDWKGVMYIINAFKKILKKYPDTFLVLANAEGPQEKEIKSLLKTLPDDSYIEIKFENDILALYTTFDLFVHVPIDLYCEAFGQVYIEAMAMNIPCIVTLSGIASEYIKNMENALVVPYKDTDALIKAMEFAFNNPNTMKLLAKNAKNDVIKLFPIQKQISQFVNLYEQK